MVVLCLKQYIMLLLIFISSCYRDMESSIEELSLNDILENTVKSYDKVLSSHEDILTAKVFISIVR